MSDSESMSDWSEQFPVVNRPVWLNHAAISPWPSSVIQAMRDFVEQNAHDGPTHYAEWMAVEQRLRNRLARLIRADSDDDIALVKNTSDGLNMIANGLDWQAGDAVICCAGDFPSNLLPWQQLQVRGVEIREIAIADDQGLPLNDPEAELIAALDRRVRLMAVSSVRYDSGLKLDLARLGSACRQFGSLLAVDAIQQLGALSLHVDELPIDFVVAGSHKWLLSPEGLALFWSSPSAREQLHPAQIGWRMWHDPFNFERSDWRPPGSARKFEPGTLNMAGIHGLNAALDLLLQIGSHTIEAGLSTRIDYLLRRLEARSDLQIITPLPVEQRAGIVSFRHSVKPAASIVHELHKLGIHCARRGSWVRLSPHFYTPFEQLDFTLKSIGSVLQAC